MTNFSYPAAVMGEQGKNSKRAPQTARFFGAWKTSSCPDPIYCLTLENPTDKRCRDLAGVTDLDVLGSHLSGFSEKEKFHATANPRVPIDWVLPLLNLRDGDAVYHVESILRGALMNPNLKADTLPHPNEIGRNWRLAQMVLPFEELVPDDLLYGIAQTADPVVWTELVSRRNLSAEVCELLLSNRDAIAAKKWLARKPGAHPNFLAAALSSVSSDTLKDPGVTYTSEALVAREVASNNTLPMELIFTCRIYDERAEELAVRNAEAREDEAVAWLTEHHPDLVGVPFEWVRQALSP